MKIFRALALTSVSLLSIAAPAFAQDGAVAEPAASEPAANEAIIVTARRREEDVQDIPLTVNVVTASTLENLNIRDGRDVQTLIPGLQLRTEANGVGGSAQLRGVQYDINTGAPPSAAFYLNDAPVEASVVLQTMYDVGQVSVERGPQGTLRGISAPSGAIVVTTRKPDLEEFGGYVQATGNDIGTINVNGAVGVPIIPGIAAIRIAGALDTNEGNRVRTIETRGDARDPYSKTQGGRASVLVTPADWLRLEGVYQRTDRNVRSFAQYETFPVAVAGALPSVGVITAKDRLSIQETPTYIDQKFEIYNWRAEVALAGQRLIYQGGHNRFDVTSITNQDSANFLVGRDFNQTVNTSSRQSTHEVRLQNEERLFDMVDYVVGYYNSSMKAATNLTQQTPVLLPASFGGGIATIAQTPISSLRDGAITEESIFGNLTVHLGESTELSGGLRHIDSHNPVGRLIIAGNTTLTPAKDDKGWVYVASIKHNFTPDFMVYAMTGTSRRIGPNLIGDFSALKSPFQMAFSDLPTETSRSYEIGFKSSWLDNRLRLNATAYHQTFKNYAYRAPTGIYYVNYTATVSNGVVTTTPGVSAVNFGAAVPVEVNGVEAELSFAITPEWNIGINGSYALGKIKNGLVACTDLNGDGVNDGLTAPPSLAALQAVVGANNVSGCRVTQRSSFQSPFSATIQSEYRHSISPKVDGFLRGLLSFNGRSQGDPGYAFDQVDAYGLLNVFTGVRAPDGQWELSLYAKNILDKTEVTNRGLPAVTNYQQLSPSFTAVAATATSSYAQISTTAPREFGLNFRFAFGSR
nr:TonB-dependent receptor [Sphingobium boeckii]